MIIRKTRTLIHIVFLIFGIVFAAMSASLVQLVIAAHSFEPSRDVIERPSDSINGVVFTVGIGLSLYLVCTEMYKRFLLLKRQSQLRSMMSTASLNIGESQRFFAHSILHNLDKHRQHFQNIKSTGDTAVAEFTYVTQRQLKNDQYDAITYYSIVGVAPLSKQVPHVFFDSRKNDKQWRLMFANDQRYSFEGDFDEYFTTYIPDQQHINSLSFITPEVMQKMKGLSRYDFEIRNNRLYVYSQLDSNAQQIATIFEDTRRIAVEFNNNLAAYGAMTAYHEPASRHVEIGLVRSKIFFVKAAALACVVTIGSLSLIYFLLFISNQSIDANTITSVLVLVMLSMGSIFKAAKEYRYKNW